MSTSKQLIALLVSNIHEVDFVNGKKPYLQCLGTGSDGKSVSIRSKGVDITHRFLHGEHITLNLSSEAVGVDGITAYDDESNPGLGFTARFSGEVCSVFVPLTCIMALLAKDGTTMTPVALIATNATVVDLFTLMQIATFLDGKGHFMAIEYMRLPHSEKKRAMINGSNFKLVKTDDKGTRYFIFEVDGINYPFNLAPDTSLQANGSSISPDDNIVIVNLFTPVNEYVQPYAVIHEGSLGIGDAELTQVLNSVRDAAIEESSARADKAPTEKTSGNVVAVNFGTKEIVR